MNNIKIVKKIFKDLTLYIGIFGTFVFIGIKEDGCFGELISLSAIPIMHQSIDKVVDNYTRKRDK